MRPIVLGMPMCEIGKRCYDKWRENADLAEILNAKWRHGIPVGAMPDDTSGFSPEAINGRAKVARNKFVEHVHSCSSCKANVFVD
jgi:hypothetical protein